MWVTSNLVSRSHVAAAFRHPDTGVSRNKATQKGDNYAAAGERHHDRCRGLGPLQDVLRGRLGLHDRPGLSSIREVQSGRGLVVAGPLRALAQIELHELRIVLVD